MMIDLDGTLKGRGNVKYVVEVVKFQPGSTNETPPSIDKRTLHGPMMQQSVLQGLMSVQGTLVPR